MYVCILTYFLPHPKIGPGTKTGQKWRFIIKYVHVKYHWKAYGKEIS